MNAIVIQKLDERTLERISRLAASHHVSIEDEIVNLLETATRTREICEERVRVADAIAAMTPKGVTQSDSTLLIREDRDR